jgi:EAL and modified HD-GYP domain-containing signal transduction protein
MNVFVARQPIFDTRKRVVAYELLFRAGPENWYPPNTDGDMASARVISDAMITFDWKKLTSGKKAYVNVTRKVLCEGLYAVLPPRETVIELLESVHADTQTLAAVRSARAAGYQVALDDFVHRPELEAFVPLANILKIDLLATPMPERQRIARNNRGKNTLLLAEKVETAEDFREAEKSGYTLFQGYFFERPEIISRADISPSKMTYVHFLKELQAETLDFARIEEVIKHDISLSVKLLKFLNSATFGWRSRVTSLHQAMVLLGERQFRKWASLVAVVGMTQDRPTELAAVSLARARFAERLSALAGLNQGRELDAFLVGLLSALDAMIGRPMQELLSEISVSPDIDRALLETDSPLGKIRALVVAYEHARWDEVAVHSRALGIAESVLPDLATQSMAWANEILPS